MAEGESPHQILESQPPVRCLHERLVYGGKGLSPFWFSIFQYKFKNDKRLSSFSSKNKSGRCVSPPHIICTVQYLFLFCFYETHLPHDTHSKYALGVYMYFRLMLSAEAHILIVLERPYRGSNSFAVNSLLLTATSITAGEKFVWLLPWPFQGRKVLKLMKALFLLTLRHI